VGIALQNHVPSIRESRDQADLHLPSSVAAQDRWNVHFSAEPQLLSPEAIASADARDWRTERRSIPGYGRFVEQRPVKSAPIDSGIKNRVSDTDTDEAGAIQSNAESLSLRPYLYLYSCSCSCSCG
jgi:hypothetical protein